MRVPLLSLAVLGMIAPASAEVYRFKTATVSEGLASNSVYSIFQDRAGYVWFATDAGASRFDGASFLNLGMPEGLVDTSVRAILQDREGRLWFVTKGGLSRWDGNTFQNYTTAQGLAHEEVRCGLLARDGSLWFGTSAGISRFDGRSFVNFGREAGLPEGPVWTLLEDRNGVLWAGVRGGGLLRREGDRFVPEGPAPGSAAATVFDLEEDPSGGLWVATDGGLGRLVDGTFRLYTQRDGLPRDNVSSVLVDRFGRVWCGTFGGGIARLEDGRFEVFSRQKGLPDNYVTALHLDYEGNVWIGSLWRGAFRFAGEQFRGYGPESGLGPGLVTGLAQGADDAIWIASVTGGLTRLAQDGSARRYGVAEGLPEESQWALLVDGRGRVWTGGPGGVSVQEGEHFRTYRLAELGARDRLDSAGEDGRGVVYFGSSAARSTGVVAFDGKAVKRYAAADGLAHNQVNSFSTDRQGRLWICTEGGLSRFDGTAFRSYRVADGLPHKRTTVAHEDAQGRLWVGTADGLARLDGDHFQVWRKSDGLPSDLVTALVERDGVLWVGTPAGLATFDGQRFRTFDTRDGLISEQISMDVALLARDGSLWFGTAAGAVRQRPVREMVERLPPRVALTQVTGEQRSFPPAASFRLQPDETTLSFAYAGLSFRDEHAVRYRTRLAGFDRDWSVPRAERSIRFTNLPPGSYRFEVAARVEDGPWSAPVGVAFELPAPFWKTGWFRILALLAAGLLGLTFYKLRIREVRREQQRLHQQRLQGQQELLSAIRVINSGLDLDEVLANIAVEGAKLVDGEPGGIGLVRDGAVVFRKLWRAGALEDVDLRVPLGQGVVGKVAQTGESRIVDAPDQEPMTPRPGFEPEYARGFLTVAVRDRSGAVVGVLEVRRGGRRRPFLDTDRLMLESLAHQAAVAIENASLFGDLEDKKVLLSETVWAMEELWKNEQQMREKVQELDRLKTNFMIVTAHEMRTPLTILKGHHDALLSGLFGEPAAGQRRFLEVCQRTVDRMATAFDDIVEMLKLEERKVSLRRSRFAPEALARDVVEGLNAFLELRRQHVEVDAEPGLPELLADRDKLHLALTNLVENAIRFTPDAGRIGVRLRCERDTLRLEVTDTGIGIAAPDLERIFDKFYTSLDELHHQSGTYQFKTRGAGLGLAITRAYVEAHGGRVWAESPGADRGSTFHVALPFELKGLD